MSRNLNALAGIVSHNLANRGQTPHPSNPQEEPTP
jgi:hypothetical protein